MSTAAGWWVVVPLKDLARAKSRLHLPSRQRRTLAAAMARDTLQAVLGAQRVDGVTLVCERPDDAAAVAPSGVRVLVAPGVRLNEAISLGAAAAAAVEVNAAHRGTYVAALPADLPYLASNELDAALEAAGRWRLACVPDRDGVGTTLLTALNAHELTPAYGTDSLVRHRARGAQVLGVPAASGLRLDVDQVEHLAGTRGRAALGAHTRAVLDQVRDLVLTPFHPLLPPFEPALATHGRHS